MARTITFSEQVFQTSDKLTWNGFQKTVKQLRAGGPAFDDTVPQMWAKYKAWWPTRAAPAEVIEAPTVAEAAVEVIEAPAEVIEPPATAEASDVQDIATAPKSHALKGSDYGLELLTIAEKTLADWDKLDFDEFEYDYVLEQRKQMKTLLHGLKTIYLTLVDSVHVAQFNKQAEGFSILMRSIFESSRYAVRV